jgi:hypothetical protein
MKTTYKSAAKPVGIMGVAKAGLARAHSLASAMLIGPCLILLCLAGCASPHQVDATTKASRDTVWQACIDAMADVNYQVTSSDKSSGLLIGEQSVVMGHGQVCRLSISVSEKAGATSVTVRWVPAPGTGGGGSTAKDYADALKKRVPDLESVVVK